MRYTTKQEFDDLTYKIVGAAIHVHRSLGPGLLESIYHECMKIELSDRGVQYTSEQEIPIIFNNRLLES